MEKYLYVIPELCTGCNRCVYICSAIHEGYFVPSKARIHINNFPSKGRSVPSICFQCQEAPCVAACGPEALERNPEGVVVVNREKCVGCGECVDACPYGMIRLDEEKGLAYKCDVCGGDPACVRECYFEALRFGPMDETAASIRERSMALKVDAETEEKKRYAWASEILNIFSL